MNVRVAQLVWARARTLLLAASVWTSGIPYAGAGELVVGEVLDAQRKARTFRILGASADDVVGGEIVFGEARYQIDRVSVRRMIGANRSINAEGGPAREFVVFSSSFNDQTATGDPWVAAHSYLHCDRPYNSFLAVYRVTNASVPQAPYASLTGDVSLSTAAVVYCFLSTRGADH